MWRFACAVVAVTAVLVVIASTRAHGADCTTTVSSAGAVSSALASASPGSTVCLADGSYGSLALDASKSAPGVTVRAEHPGKATLSGASLQGSWLTLAQFVINGEVDIMPGSSKMTVDHNRISGGYMGVNLPTDSTPVNDAAITANEFVGPFGEDAIRVNRYHDADGDGIGILIEGNEITGVRENGNHSDCLQAVWVGDHLIYRRNYLHDNRCQGFFIKDQQSPVDTVVAEDNLMVRNDAPCAVSGCGQPSIFQLFGPMNNLTVRRNTIWTPGGASPVTLRDGGWTGTRTFDANVFYRPWSDTSAPFGGGYNATNNVAGESPEGTWPATGFAVVGAPQFADPAHDDYRTNDGRGVDWAPANQVYGPSDTGTTTPPPPPPTDNTPPDTTITAGPSGPTNDTTPTFAFTASQAGATFACRVDDAAYAACTSPWTTAALADGDHTVSVRAGDQAGNTDASPATRAFTVDTVAPRTTLTSAPPAQTDATTAAIAFSASEDGSTSECRVDAGAWAPCTSPYQVSGLAPGQHSVGVRSTDTAGNVESPGASATWTVGSGGGNGEPPPAADAPPTVQLTAPAVDSAVSGRFRFAADASDDHGIDHVDLWVGRWRADTDDHEPYVTYVDASRMRPGLRTLSARAFDAAGHAASAAITVRVRPDDAGQDTSGWAQLTSTTGDGLTRLAGQTAHGGDVRVSLTPCDSTLGTVVDQFTLHADAEGHLDATYAGANRCVLRLDPVTG